MFRFSTLLAVLAVVFSMSVGHGIAQSNSTKPVWKLTAAQNASDGRHLVITVKRGSPKQLKTLMKTFEKNYRVDVVAEWPLASIGVHCFVLRVDNFTSVKDTVAELEKDKNVRTVQPMNQFKTLTDRVAYKDDLFKLQTNLRDLDIAQAHRRVTGKNVKIAVIDTGVDLSHPDFSRQNIAGKDFVGVGIEKVPKERHGTAIAGVIAASNNNKKGIVGIAPNAEIFAMRGCWEPAFGGFSGRCSTFSLARALNFAIQKDMDIINMSLGGPFDPLLQELIDKAVEDHGILVVAAYGNSKKTRFPAGASNVIGVAGKGGGKSVIRAPDIDILSTAPNGKYDFYSGSSVATAHISAVAALMLEANKKLKPKRIFQIIQQSLIDGKKEKFFNTCEIISSLKPLRCL